MFYQHDSEYGESAFEANVANMNRLAPCSTATVYGTVFATVYVHDVVTITHTITNTPPTVTILEQDPDSVLSSWASLDTEFVIEQSQLLPISDHRDPNPTQFTYSVSVSGFEATEVSYPGNTGTVFYVSKTGGTAQPTDSILVEVTTLTIIPTFAPFPSTVANQGKAVSASDFTLPTAFTSSPSGWNDTNSNSSLWAAATGYGGIVPSAEPTSTITVTNTVATVTRVVAGVGSVTSVVPSYGYEPEPYGYPPPKADNTVDKRQTCLWVSATIGGRQVGWCNNWDGTATVSYTSWETTGE